MKDFSNKVAAITGAGSGMGRTLALQLASEGCHLSLSDVNTKGLAETAALLADSKVNVFTDIVDVANREAVFAWADKVASDHGKVNLIFNNAGVALGNTIEHGSLEDFEWVININFWGVVYGSKAFLPHLRASGEGHIINTSSLFGIIGVPTQGAYNSSKFAVRGYTECLRQEMDLSGGAVSATSVHPGGINTNIAKSARLSDPDLATPKNMSFMQKGLETNTPEHAANVILNAVRKNKRRVLVGYDAKIVDFFARWFPSLYQLAVSRLVKKMWPASKSSKA
jgi:short-subunit dehydrogenase